MRLRPRSECEILGRRYVRCKRLHTRTREGNGLTGLNDNYAQYPRPCQYSAQPTCPRRWDHRPLFSSGHRHPCETASGCYRPSQICVCAYFGVPPCHVGVGASMNVLRRHRPLSTSLYPKSDVNGTGERNVQIRDKQSMYVGERTRPHSTTATPTRRPDAHCVTFPIWYLKHSTHGSTTEITNAPHSCLLIQGEGADLVSPVELYTSSNWATIP